MRHAKGRRGLGWIKAALALVVLLAAVALTVQWLWSDRTPKALQNHLATQPPQHDAASPLTPQPPAATQVDASRHELLLVNAWSPLPQDTSLPDLVTVYDDKGRHVQLANSGIKLERSTYEAADAMFAAAELDGVTGFILTSGYRDSVRQAELYEEGVAQGKDTVAKPGQSEHETGLAFDVTAKHILGFDTTPQFRWLEQHAWEFGFILRYPEDKRDVTGVPYEPWHYRYVGREAAQAIYERGLTLEEYLQGGLAAAS